MSDAQKAKALLKRLFDEAAKDPGPYQPTYFVPQAVFEKELRKAGIFDTNNAIELWNWQDSIGLPEFAHKLFAAYHKAHGTDFTPMEKGAWRLRMKQKRLTKRTNRLVSSHDVDTQNNGQQGRESQEPSKITSSQAQLAESFRVDQEEKRK